MKYLVFAVVCVIVATGFAAGDAALASEPQMIDENRVRGDAHPDSCTRWQQWDFGVCVEKTDYPAYLDAFHFLQLVTIPFVGGATIFVFAVTTPKISRRKRIAVITPCAILLLFSTSIIFFGGFSFL